MKFLIATALMFALVIINATELHHTYVWLFGDLGTLILDALTVIVSYILLFRDTK